MKNIFRDFFTFNKRERNGVFVLLSIICVLVLYLNISSRFVSQEPVNFDKFDKDVERFRSSVKEKEVFSDFTEGSNSTSINKSVRFNFDPNNSELRKKYLIVLRKRQKFSKAVALMKKIPIIMSI